MEANVLIPLIAGFLGTIVGAAASVLTIWIQQKSQSKRDKIKLASEMAKQDQKFMYDVVKEQGHNGSLLPIAVYQHYHFELLTALEKGKLTDEKIVEITTENKKLISKILELNNHNQALKKDAEKNSAS
jgi:gas vesicle protein